MVKTNDLSAFEQGMVVSRAYNELFGFGPRATVAGTSHSEFYQPKSFIFKKITPTEDFFVTKISQMRQNISPAPLKAGGYRGNVTPVKFAAVRLSMTS
jgi:hypothetical protein